MFEETKYPAVRILIWLLGLAGALPTFVGIFALLAGGLAQYQQKPGILLWTAILVSLGPLLLGLLLFACSELLRVMIDIEENTRKAGEELSLLPLSLRSDPIDRERSGTRL
jgi:hypothetical protein